MTEREFIIALAVNAFNQQYNASLLVENFDVKSIQPNQFTTLAYEVYTVRFDDFVRLRLYLNFDQYDSIGNYRLEVDGSEGIGVLVDEVYVATGIVDRFYKESGLYKFNWLGQDITSWDIFLTENEEALLTEIGDYFIEETGA